MSILERADEVWQMAHRRRDLDMVAFRIDPMGWRDMVHANDGLRSSSIWERENTYRGLPVILEDVLPPESPTEVSPNDEVPPPVPVLTIECKDRRTGRMVYVDLPSQDESPKAKRGR